MRHWILPGAAIAATLWLAAGPALADASKDITIVVPDSIDNLDPCRSARNDVGRVIKQNVTETLTELKAEDGSIQPRLATSWQQLDSNTWRLKLRTGVKFHDGSVFDANAVARSIDRTLNPKLDCINRQKFFGGVTLTPKVIDAETIEITTSPPQPILPTLLSTMTVVPASTPVDQSVKNPVGTGPYVFKDWQPGQKVTLERFDGYWGAKPEVERAIFVYRGESAVAAAMVKTGEADLAPYIAVQDATNPKTDISYLNTDTAQVVLANNVPPLNDMRVRKALNLAVDRQAFIGTILSKDVQPASQLVLPFINGYAPDLKPWPYDPTEAKKLIAAAKADGVPVDRELTLFGRPGFLPNLPDVMSALAQMWGEVGLNVKTQMIEKAQFIKLVSAPHPADRPAGMFLNLHDNASGDAVFTLFFKYSSKGGQSELADPQLDALIVEGGQSTGDKRRELYQQAFRRITRDIVPDVMLFHLVGNARVGPRIEFKPNALTNNELQIAEIRFKPKS
jgi:peptide/nickel transport system substrate-binding protein